MGHQLHWCLVLLKHLPPSVCLLVYNICHSVETLLPLLSHSPASPCCSLQHKPALLCQSNASLKCLPIVFLDSMGLHCPFKCYEVSFDVLWLFQFRQLQWFRTTSTCHALLSVILLTYSTYYLSSSSCSLCLSSSLPLSSSSLFSSGCHLSSTRFSDSSLQNFNGWKKNIEQHTHTSSYKNQSF